MSPERWQRLEQLFHRCQDEGESTRRRILEQELAEEPEMRQELVLLLRAENTTDSFLEPPSSFSTEPPAPAEASEEESFPVGSHLGPYRITKVLASGGMGTVLLAERNDSGFSQSVAVKVIKASRLGPHLRERFRLERQILARLQHPNIARLYDGGTTADGTEYFVMEYVDGRAIDEYCEKNRLTIRQRVQLFQQVCRAVHIAHQHLVVHRDLKPSNILVGADGTPKLLDFGIAKNLDRTQEGSDLTRTAQRAMTPEYASPEQVRGEAITTATDVYSLGVLLHQLLAGGSPYRTTSAFLHELERAICDDDPARPSETVARHPEAESNAERRGTDSRGLRRALRGDLDAVVMKAMRKEPSQRYASAEDLASDLQRTLDLRPVLASPPSDLDRLRKYARRNPVASSLWAACVLIAMVASGIGWRYWVDVRHARSAAEQEAQRFRSSSNVLAGLLMGADPWRSDDEFLDRKILDRTERRLESSEPLEQEVEMLLRLQLARSLISWGEYEKAGQHVELAVAKLDAGSVPAEPAQIAAFALEGARARLRNDQPEQAARWLDRGRKELRNAAQPQPTLLAQLDLQEAVLAQQRGDRVGCEQKLRAAEARIEADPSISRSLFSHLWNTLGMLRVEQGRPVEAEALYRKALEIVPQSSGQGPSRALLEANLSEALRLQGRNSEACAAADSSLATRLAIFGPASTAVMNSLCLLGLAETDAEKLDVGIEHLEQALAIAREKLAPNALTLSSVLNNLARAYRAKGDRSRAAEFYRESLDIVRLRDLAYSARTATLESNLGSVLSELSRFEEAEQLLERSLEFRLEQSGEKSLDTSYSLFHLGVLYSQRREFRRSLEYFERSLESRRSCLHPDHPLITDSLWRTAQVEVELKEWSRAIELLDECRAIQEDTEPMPLARLARVWTLLGDCLVLNGEKPRAEEMLRAALETLETVTDPDAEPAVLVRAALQKVQSR